MLSIYNLQSPCSDLFGKQGRVFLQDIQEQLSATHQLLIEDYLLMIDTLGERIKQLDKHLREWSKTDPRAALLMGMPGVGVYSATIILAEIGSIDRFQRAKQLCSFAGLAPSTRSSDMRVHHGRITREGSSWLRWIMVSAAHSAPRRSPRLKAFLERMANKHGRKTARVALARKMLSIVFYMLQRNEPYQEAYPLS